MNDLQAAMQAHEQNAKQRIPEHTLEALERYVNDKIPPGSFLTAVLCNNLKEAFSRADDFNIANMFAIVKYCYNNLPANCWGCYEAFENWLKKDNDMFGVRE